MPRRSYRAYGSGPIAAMALAALLGGCVVGPNYSGPPKVAADAVSAPAFHRAGQASAEPPPSHWWTELGDPELDHLIEAAFAASPDVEIATARLRQSRATLKGDRANLFPTAGPNAVLLHTKGLTSAFTGQQGGGAGGSDSTLNFYDANFDATWELDLFGGKRRAVQGDQARAEAARANLEDAEVSLAAEVAQDYVALRDLQTRLRLALSNVEVESRMLDLVRLQRAGGAASDLDVERLVTQLQATRAQDSPLEAQIADRLDRLAVLTGRAPGDLDAELNPPAPVPLPPEKVAVGDPAALLKRRPDVRAAERAIKQKTALIGQRTADLFPKVTLLGEVGYGSSQLSTLLSSNAFSYAAAPILQWSPFDFGRTRARIDEAKGERDEALGQYRKTVLGALRDAETALETYGRQRDELKSLDAVQASADRAARLTTLRAQGGTATILDELQAESSRVNAQSNASQARAQLTEDFISLQKSLGLGWAAE